ncbi:Gata transcription factor [Mycena indigotica]|uniref:Gata transcription factor n=1 Tax=Mycena indigotica TaxID=2126181 RepID=A0A8H6W8V7_9AGAR|nr:Gata transcription factor [Mycena indigotica]KAF7303534.1 Gata transcription factor [Mycena indigotica]
MGSKELVTTQLVKFHPVTRVEQQQTLVGNKNMSRDASSTSDFASMAEATAAQDVVTHGADFGSRNGTADGNGSGSPAPPPPGPPEGFAAGGPPQAYWMYGPPPGGPPYPYPPPPQTQASSTSNGQSQPQPQWMPMPYGYPSRPDQPLPPPQPGYLPYGIPIPGYPHAPPQPPSSAPVQSGAITLTDDADTKLSHQVKRRCFNCVTTDTSTWRRSQINPGKVLCNKCGLFERTHSRSRPMEFPHKRVSRASPYPAPGTHGGPSGDSISAPPPVATPPAPMQYAYIPPPPLPGPHSASAEQHRTFNGQQYSGEMYAPPPPANSQPNANGPYESISARPATGAKRGRGRPKGSVGRVKAAAAAAAAAASAPSGSAAASRKSPRKGAEPKDGPLVGDGDLDGEGEEASLSEPDDGNDRDWNGRD